MDVSSLFFVAWMCKKTRSLWHSKEEIRTLSKREIYEQKTEEILNPIMEELEFELVDEPPKCYAFRRCGVSVK